MPFYNVRFRIGEAGRVFPMPFGRLYQEIESQKKDGNKVNG